MSLLKDVRLLVASLHYLFMWLVLVILSRILPDCYVDAYKQFSYVFLGLLIARFTFEFMKDAYFKSEINPRNKAVLITGCDRGFGHDLAKKLDSKGFHVFASCLYATGEGAKELRETCSDKLQILELDVTNDGSVKNAVENVNQSLGTKELWAVVNNAGFLASHLIDVCSIEDFRKCLEVNTLGQVRVTKAFLSLLKKSKGRVVNLNSLSGRFSVPNFTPYVISKFAAVAFTECLRQEIDVWGIKVISVEPEFFQTQMTNRETLGKVIEASANQLDKSTRDSYGEKFLKDFKTFQQNLFSRSSANVHYVIDALESAVCLEHPDTIYQPIRNGFVKIMFYIGERIPKCLIDSFIQILYYLFRFPTPKDCKKYQ